MVQVEPRLDERFCIHVAPDGDVSAGFSDWSKLKWKWYATSHQFTWKVERRSLESFDTQEEALADAAHHVRAD